MKTIFSKIYALPLEVVVIIVVATLFLWTFIGLYTLKTKNNSLRTTWYIINAVLSFIFVFIILYFTVFNRSNDYIQNISFIRTINQIKEQKELIREMIMNTFLFFPLGLTMPYGMLLMKNEKLSPVVFTMTISLILSILIELIQFTYKCGNAELSDIVTNCLGTFIGAISYFLVQKNNYDN